MNPFLEYGGGNFQDTRTLVELSVVTVKLLGACEGTEINKKFNF